VCHHIVRSSLSVVDDTRHSAGRGAGEAATHEKIMRNKQLMSTEFAYGDRFVTTYIRHVVYTDAVKKLYNNIFIFSPHIILVLDCKARESNHHHEGKQ
jgi:hypothetical protein